MEIMFLLLLIIQLLPSQHEVVSAASTVEYLPGLDGPLPFPLETGYVGVGKDEQVQLFYYFLPSQSDPTKDPLFIWISGGPGCSSLIPIVSEIGPLRFAENPYNGSLPTLVLNPHAWTKVASIIFLDQPVNTGFSYGTTSAAYKYTDVQGCEYVHEFVRKWLRDHSQFISNPFYVGGNSYSGRLVPVVTQLISDGNTGGTGPLVNLQGYVLGNPITFPTEYNYHVPYCHNMGLISDELYESLKKNCKGDYIIIDPKNRACADDMQTFQEMISNINTEHILMPNCGVDEDLQGPHKLSGERRLLDDKLIALQHVPIQCIADWRKLIKYWANDVEVQEALHIRKGIIGTWVRCRRSIYKRSDNFTITIEDAVPYHANLSIKGLRSLIYSGDHDFTVPFQSTQAWIRSLNYSVVDDWRPWSVNDQVSGYTRSYSNKMTFATVKGSGHQACTYKPEECFVMFKEWTSHQPL